MRYICSAILVLLLAVTAYGQPDTVALITDATAASPFARFTLADHRITKESRANILRSLAMVQGIAFHQFTENGLLLTLSGGYRWNDVFDEIERAYQDSVNDIQGRKIKLILPPEFDPDAPKNVIIQ